MTAAMVKRAKRKGLCSTCCRMKRTRGKKTCEACRERCREANRERKAAQAALFIPRPWNTPMAKF